MALTYHDKITITRSLGLTAGQRVIELLDSLNPNFRLLDTQWDDLNVPLNTTAIGANSLPHYDYTNLGLLFPQNDTDEIAYMVFQMKHSKQLGTAIKLHVHYVQAAAAQPTFKADYRFYNNGSTVPAEYTTVSTADGNKGVFAYPGSGSVLQIASFPEIAAPSSEGVSANLDVKLYRDDNDVTGDVLAKYVDLHFQINKLGSDDEYSNNE